MYILKKYNQAATINFPLLDAATDDLKTGLTFAAGEVKIKKDEGASANTTNLPAEEGEGTYSLALTATEMSAARIVITLIDASSPKLWRDQTLIIETYGHASGEHAFDLDAASVAVGSMGAGVITSSAIAANAIGDAALAADVDTYQAKAWLFDDDLGTTDRYVAIWYKNGQPVTSGITSPTIQVIKAADGTDLIASSAMTPIGSSGMYKYDATGAARITDGAAYIAKVQATIDGSTRAWYQPVGRDSK